MLAAYPITVIFVLAAMFALIFVVPQSLTLARVGRENEPRPDASPTLAVAALVFAVFVPPMGIVLGNFALLRISLGVGSGRTVALLAVVIGVVFLVVEVVLLIAAYYATAA